MLGMNMKIFNKIIFILAITLSNLFNFAQATVIDNNTYTTVNGLDWLDWSFTSELTQEEAIEVFDKPGYGNAFRLATHEEAIAMLEAVFIDTYKDIDGREGIPWNGGDKVLHQDSYAAEFTIDFLDLFGTSNSPDTFSGRFRSYGYIDDGAYGIYEEEWIFGGSASFNADQGGIALVRVPAPSTSILFAIFLAFIITARQKSSM